MNSVAATIFCSVNGGNEGKFEGVFERDRGISHQPIMGMNQVK